MAKKGEGGDRVKLLVRSRKERIAEWHLAHINTQQSVWHLRSSRRDSSLTRPLEFCEDRILPSSSDSAAAFSIDRSFFLFVSNSVIAGERARARESRVSRYVAIQTRERATTRNNGKREFLTPPRGLRKFDSRIPYHVVRSPHGLMVGRRCMRGRDELVFSRSAILHFSNRLKRLLSRPPCHSSSGCLPRGI